MNKTDLPGSVLLFLRFGATFAPFRLGVGNVAVSRRSTRHEEVAGGEVGGGGAILALRASLAVWRGDVTRCSDLCSCVSDRVYTNP